MQLHRYFMGQSSEFCCHNPLCCFLTSNTKGQHIFHYRLSPETFGYTFIYQRLNFVIIDSNNTLLLDENEHILFALVDGRSILGQRD